MVWYGYNLKMSLKCLLYARYSSSIPINTIIKDSSKELKSDLDRVLVVQLRCLPRLRPWKVKLVKEKNCELLMEFGLLLMMPMIFVMPFVLSNRILRGMHLVLLKNCRKRYHRYRMLSTKLKITSSPILKKWQLIFWKSTVTYRKLIK